MDQLRKEYSKFILEEMNLNANPVEQFNVWFNEALEANVSEPTAMILSTANINARPSSRVVLLKKISDNGLVFFTNYESRKGKELLQNPYASLLFFWDHLERQIRIEGKVEKINEEDSENYFNSRPFSSRIGAIISQQSAALGSRSILEEKMNYYLSHPEEVKRPAHWGGYCLSPDYFEFWQGRENRLHDRISYVLENTKWKLGRLAP